MEKASRRSWTECENSPRTIELIEYVLREFWEIFVDGRPSCRDACFKHAKVQPKAVFSCAMAIMDAIQGWQDEEKRVGSKFAACMWIYSTEVLTRGQTLNPEMERDLKKRMMSIMLCMNWVCAGAFDDHEWVSESTITQHAEEAMDTRLVYQIGIPCVVLWCILWFSAPARIGRTLEKQYLKIKKHHEVVKITIMDTISKTFGGEHKPRSCMLQLWQRRTKHTQSGE